MALHRDAMSTKLPEQVLASVSVIAFTPPCADLRVRKGSDNDAGTQAQEGEPARKKLRAADCSDVGDFDFATPVRHKLPTTPGGGTTSAGSTSSEPDSGSGSE